MISSSTKNGPEDTADRTVSQKSQGKEEGRIQNMLRPQNLSHYVGQSRIKKHLEVSIASAKKRGEPLEHILFYGPPGLGKTTLSMIIAQEMGSQLKATSGPAIEKQSDLMSVLSSLEPGDILFIDEIHRLRPQVEEILYTAMEDFHVDIMVGSGTGSQSVKLPLQPFTLIGATTRLSSLSAPLRDRFGNVLKLDFYDSGDISQILQVNAKNLELHIPNDILLSLAGRSRGTPRIANRLLKIVRDYITIGRDITDPEEFSRIFEDIFVDEKGLDYLDLQYLRQIGEKFHGGPVGLGTLSSILGEEEATLEDVVEPYLLQIGFIEKTPRGRKITGAGQAHIT